MCGCGQLVVPVWEPDSADRIPELGSVPFHTGFASPLTISRNGGWKRSAGAEGGKNSGTKMAGRKVVLAGRKNEVHCRRLQEEECCSRERERSMYGS